MRRRASSSDIIRPLSYVFRRQCAHYIIIYVTFVTFAKNFHTLVTLMGQSYDRGCYASNIQDSAVVQGNNARTLIVRNGKEPEVSLSAPESELLRVFHSLSVKGQTKLLTYAYELENEEVAKDE